MNESLCDKLNQLCRKVSENFCAISFEYHRACIRQLGSMHVLANARISGPVNMRYRPSKQIVSMGTNTNVYVVVC